MKTYLHKLREGFIITSDEDSKRGTFYCFRTKTFFEDEGEDINCCNSDVKVIAQQDQIDFSALSEEEQKEIGWFDVEKLAAKEVKGDNQAFVNSPYNMENYGFDMYCIGFQKAQELLYDSELFDTEIQVVGDNKTISIREFLSQSKSWEVEIEKEISNAVYHNGDMVFPIMESSAEYKPKFTNGKIKILKLL